jgi:hypothetical protein
MARGLILAEVSNRGVAVHPRLSDFTDSHGAIGRRRHVRDDDFHSIGQSATHFFPLFHLVIIPLVVLEGVISTSTVDAIARPPLY